MSFLGEVAAWLADPAHWQGSDGVPVRVLEHLQLSLLSVAVAAAVALPIGMYIGHTGRGAFIAVTVANLGRALPSLAILAFALPVSISLGLGLGFWPTFMALVPLAITPILVNTYAGIRATDPDTVEAARGMGMRPWQVLWAVELPAALPVLLAGLRTSTANVIATATLGAIVAGPALGRYIVDGFALQDHPRVFVGALLVAILAWGTELGFGLLERVTGHTRLAAAGVP